MDLVSKCKIFRLVSPFFPIKMAKWAQKFRHLKWVSFFELDETESNEPSVKMQHFWSLYNDNFYSTFGLSLNYPWFILGPLMEPPDGSGTFVPGEIRATDPGFSPLSSRRISLDGMTWRNFPSGFSPSPPPPPSTFHHITPTVNISSALIGPCLQGCHLLRFLTRASGAPNRWRWLSSLDSEVQRALLGSSMMNPC